MGDIRIITEPTLRLVGYQAVNEVILDEFLADEGAEHWVTDTEIGSQVLVEVAGRLCYKSYAKPRPGGNSAYIGHILEVAHGSVLEHAVYNFIITGVSRSFTHELVRHRAGWAYSQRSQRFCDETDASMVMPPFIVECKSQASSGHYWGIDPDADEARSLDKMIAGCWKEAVENAQKSYETLSSLIAARIVLQDRKAGRAQDSTARRKKAREAARSVLPNATETQIFVTVNARAARHFIEARGDEHADAEIRAVAIAMLGILRTHSPNIFGDYTTHDVPGCGTVATTAHRKV